MPKRKRGFNGKRTIATWRENMERKDDAIEIVDTVSASALVDRLNCCRCQVRHTMTEGNNDVIIRRSDLIPSSSTVKRVYIQKLLKTVTTVTYILDPVQSPESTGRRIQRRRMSFSKS